MIIMTNNNLIQNVQSLGTASMDKNLITSVPNLIKELFNKDDRLFMIRCLKYNVNELNPF
jgi:hypothetical protein